MFVKFRIFLLMLSVIIYSIVLLSLGYGFNFERNQRVLFLPKLEASPEIVLVQVDENTLAKEGKWPWSKSKLAKTIQLILDANPKSLGINIYFRENNREEINTSNFKEVISNPKISLASELKDWQLSQQWYGESNQLGFTSYPIDSDGQVRYLETNKQGMPSLAVKMANKQNVPQKFLLNPNVDNLLSLSLSDIIDNRANSLLKDKYVILGGGAGIFSDSHTIPKIGLVSGNVIQAMMLNQILQNSFTNILSTHYLFEISLLVLSLLPLLFVTNLSIATIRWRIFELISIVLALSLIVIQFTQFGFNLNYVFIQVFSLFLVILLWVIYENLWQRLALSSTFRKYLSPVVVDKIMASNTSNTEIKDITVMFTDIRNFTTLSESVNSQEIGAILHQVLGLQADVIVENGGTIDKYIGDAVMAFWGAPLVDENRSFRAILAACEIQTRLVRLKKRMKQDINIGIGISSGEVSVGNFGSENRLAYTAFGDCVNTASRVESLSKQYDAKILITETVLSELKSEQKDSFEIIEVDSIRPKGKRIRVKIYEILSYNDPITNQKYQISDLDNKEDYFSALNYYYKGDFARTIDKLSHSKSKKASLLRERSYKLLATRVKDWDGVWNMEHK